MVAQQHRAAALQLLRYRRRRAAATAARTPWTMVQDAAEAPTTAAAACRFTTLRRLRVDRRARQQQPAPQRHLPRRRGPGLCRELRRGAAPESCSGSSSRDGCRARARLRRPDDPAQLEPEQRADVPDRRPPTAAAIAAEARAPRRHGAAGRDHAAQGRLGVPSRCRTRPTSCAASRSCRTRTSAPTTSRDSPSRRAVEASCATSLKRGAGAGASGSASIRSSSASSASTDTPHRRRRAVVREDQFTGPRRRRRSAATVLPPGLPDDIELNPGGLAVLWAEENSRDALFAAMRRREAYGTSGPRMIGALLRRLALPRRSLRRRRPSSTQRLRRRRADGRRSAAARAAAGARASRSGAARPGRRRAEHAAPAHPDRQGLGRRRRRDARARLRRRRATPHNGADVDLATCTPQGDAASTQLCDVWRDPEFNPAAARVLLRARRQNPTCRWSTYHCNAAGIDCRDPVAVSGRVRSLLRSAFDDRAGTRLDIADLVHAAVDERA